MSMRYHVFAKIASAHSSVPGWALARARPSAFLRSRSSREIFARKRADDEVEGVFHVGALNRAVASCYLTELIDELGEDVRVDNFWCGNALLTPVREVA
jgi:hypothetical protein